MKNPDVEDVSDAAATFFGDSRTPASLVMGFAVTALFALPKFSSVNERSTIELFFIKAYRILSWTAFVLSLHVFIICTVTSAKLVLNNAYNPMAESAKAMLLREFEYEFLAVCWCTIVSMLTFIAIVTVRVTLEFDLFRFPERRHTAQFVLSSACALMTSLLSFTNKDTSMNLNDMTMRLIRLIAREVQEAPSTMDILTLVFALGSVFYAVKSAFFVNVKKISAESQSNKAKSE